MLALNSYSLRRAEWHMVHLTSAEAYKETRKHGQQIRRSANGELKGDRDGHSTLMATRRVLSARFIKIGDHAQYLRDCQKISALSFWTLCVRLNPFTPGGGPLIECL